eukprot:725437-Pelagomonas_calceolata.AAC.1
MRPTSAQAPETRSSGRALMPFLYAIVATPFAILLMMAKSCSNSCATQYTPPSRPTMQLPCSCSCHTGEASVETPT